LYNPAAVFAFTRPEGFRAEIPPKIGKKMTLKLFLDTRRWWFGMIIAAKVQVFFV
jgi:hypothetical protein